MTQPVPEEFSTARLRAVKVAPAHLVELRRMHVCEPMMAMIGGVRDEADSITYLDRHIAHWAEHRFGFWMLYDRDTGDSAGLAGLRRLTLEGVDEVEAGYGFLPEFWGRGLGSEIARSCVAHGFAALPVPSLVALTHPDNHASRHVLTKTGMKHERDITRDGAVAALYRINRPEEIR